MVTQEWLLHTELSIRALFWSLKEHFALAFQHFKLFSSKASAKQDALDEYQSLLEKPVFSQKVPFQQKLHIPRQYFENWTTKQLNNTLPQKHSSTVDFLICHDVCTHVIWKAREVKLPLFHVSGIFPERLLHLSGSDCILCWWSHSVISQWSALV